MHGKAFTGNSNIFMKKHISPLGWIFVAAYALVGVLLFAYSYTQVDLALTLTNVSIWRSIQTWFQHIGYFDRPLSTGMFVGLILSLFVLYAFVLKMVKNQKLHGREVWTIIAVLVLATVFSYPAFSYDFFNYLFTAKTVLIYHKNPYLVTPLQFAGFDSWLSFMHWTHLASAYTPLWIMVTLVPFFFGFGYFLPLIWNLKLLIALAYIAVAMGIGKILEHEDAERAVFGIAVFAFNPLIIIECLVSPHNDIVMMALAIWAIILYRKNRKWLSWLLLSGSVAMKLMTIFLIPAFFTGWKRRITLSCMVIGFLAVLTQREALSWYWVWIVPFVALVPDLTAVLIVSAGVSLGFLLQYAPFLYFGNWNAPVPLIKLWVTWVPIVLSVLIAIIGEGRKKRMHAKKQQGEVFVR